MDFLKLAATLKILRLFTISFAKIEDNLYCSKLAFAQILMSRIKLRIMIIIGKLTLIPMERENTLNFFLGLP